MNEKSKSDVVWVWLSHDGRVRSASNDAPDADHLTAAEADGDRIVPFAPVAAPTINDALVDTLRWYGEHARDCVKITAKGDEARYALDCDRGGRAFDAIATAKRESKSK